MYERPAWVGASRVMAKGTPPQDSYLLPISLLLPPVRTCVDSFSYQPLDVIVGSENGLTSHSHTGLSGRAVKGQKVPRMAVKILF